MAKYIDADTLIKRVKDLPTWWADGGGYYGGAMKYPEGMFEPEDVISIIENIPAADVAPVVHGEPTEHIRELLRAEQDGRLVVLPCRVGDRVYQVIDDCTFPGDCGTKRMCKGCEYRNLFIEKNTFRLYLLTDDGKLRRGYYRTREEAEKALEEV